MTTPPGGITCAFRFRIAPAFVAGDDPPLIRERAATRGRSATEGAMNTPA
jgi:hypothetical protein